MKNYMVIKLQDDKTSNVYGGNKFCGKAVKGVGGLVAVSGVLGFVASGITSMVYAVKTNKALNTNNISDAKKFSGIAQRAGIAALAFAGGFAAGCYAYVEGDKIIKRGSKTLNKDEELKDAYLMG